LIKSYTLVPKQKYLTHQNDFIDEPSVFYPGKTLRNRQTFLCQFFIYISIIGDTLFKIPARE